MRPESSAVELKLSHTQPMKSSGAQDAPGANLVKINSDFEPQAGQGVSGTGAAGPAGSVQAQRTATHSSQSSATDKADLSSEAQQFATLSAQASKVPDARADRVASLKNAVQSGTYNVSNRQIAQAMQRDFNPGL